MIQVLMVTVLEMSTDVTLRESEARNNNEEQKHEAAKHTSKKDFDLHRKII